MKVLQYLRGDLEQLAARRREFEDFAIMVA